MSDYQDPIQHTSTGTPRWVGLAVGVLGGVSLLGLGLGWTAINQAKSAEQSAQASMKQTNDALSQRLAKTEEQNQQLLSDVKVVTDKLNVTQDQLISARKQTKATAVGFDQKLTGVQKDLTAQLGTKANAEDLNKLNGDVTGVKGDLDATKNNIQMARSEMGTLIARNHDEIDQLRRMVSATTSSSPCNARAELRRLAPSRSNSKTPTRKRISTPSTFSPTTRASRRRTARSTNRSSSIPVALGPLSSSS